MMFLAWYADLADTSNIDLRKMYGNLHTRHTVAFFWLAYDHYLEKVGSRWKFRNK